MTPEQFLARLAKNGPEPAYLFLGPEAFERTRCRRALLDAVLPDKNTANARTGSRATIWTAPRWPPRWTTPGRSLCSPRAA